MKHTEIHDGMRFHYTSIIGVGPSVPVTVSGEPYKMGDHWSVWVVPEGAKNGKSVNVDALYRHPVNAGVDYSERAKRAARTRKLNEERRRAEAMTDIIDAAYAEHTSI